MQVSITILIIPAREYLITSSSIPAVNVYYNGVQVGGAGLNGRFIAVQGITTLQVESGVNITGSITVKEVLRNIYNLNDGQGGTWCYQPRVEKWTSQYTYMPESFAMAGNRLVTFKNGNLYIHNSSAYNTFFGQAYDSAIAFPHNEGGNVIKTFDNIAIEGNAPELTHIRTEVPNVQSSDLAAADYDNREGVQYSSIYRDRLSPNTAGTVLDKLYKGDRMRGEIAKFILVYNQPTTLKELKFVNINFTPSTGQTV